jgi:DNA-binding response OmpR family regulator
LSSDEGLYSTLTAEREHLASSDLQSVGVPKSGHPCKILVVDDEQDIVFTLKTALTEAGFSVDAFTNPSFAFDMFTPEKYELIILDIRMPVLNGFELYMKLLEKDNSIKVLFLTAVNEFSMYSKFKRSVSPMLGKRYYLQKPIDLKKLMQRIGEMLSI